MLRKRNPLSALRSLEKNLTDRLGNGQDWIPRVDAYEEGSDLVFEFEASGLDKDDLEVELDGRRLVVSGERAVENERDDRDYHRTERAYGSFQRSFTLPATIDPSDIDAEYDDGLLTVRVPAANGGDDSTKRIEVT